MNANKRGLDYNLKVNSFQSFFDSVPISPYLFLKPRRLRLREKQRAPVKPR